ncbi:NAD(P)-dependent alcohol dehydrogenase [soil metagenome]
MITTNGYAVKSSTSPLEAFQFTRREPGPHDVLIEILYCGICHSDIHQARNEWKSSIYPMVPGHEIVGRVTQVGKEVKRFKPGDLAGVGCFVDSCRSCGSCKEGEEQHCETKITYTYNSLDKDGKTPTFGGYSKHIVVDEDYTLTISDKLPLERIAPLLCAGITTYSPLRQFGVTEGQKVAVIGLGGLGHMGVKLAVAMGAEVTVLSTSPSKEADANKLGAKHFALTTDSKTVANLANQFDFILDTASAKHDVEMYLNMLSRHGTMVMVGIPAEPFAVGAFSLIRNGRRLAGSNIGGIAETQEMLDYCALHNIAADVEVISPQQIETAFERTIKNDVKYRFVIDMTQQQ